MKLSTIFANAADYHLWNGSASSNDIESESAFSCLSIKWAINKRKVSYEQKTKMKKIAIEFAADVAEKNRNGVWFEHGSTNDRQSERYIWLKFLSLYAKDEGV